MEGINAYVNKYAYVCICDSLIIVEFANLFQYGKIGYFTRFVAYPTTKAIFHS
jgi:hypothetical protein